MRRSWWLPVVLAVGAVGIWSIADPDGFSEWEGIALITLAPFLFWTVYELARRSNGKG